MLIYFLLQKSWFIWSTNNTLRFFSEYFICHFHFFWPKILRIIFTPKAIRCYGLFSKFIGFIVDCVFFIFFGKIFLTIHFKHFDFIALCCLNSNYNNLFERSLWLFGWFFNVSVYFVYFLENLEIFFIRINSNKYTIKFSF